MAQSKFHQNRKAQKGPNRSARWGSAAPAQHAEGEWFIAGLNGVREALRSPRVKIKKLYVNRKVLGEDLGDLIGEFTGPLEEVADRELAVGNLSQGIGAMVFAPRQPEPEDLLADLVKKGIKPLFVALDQVEDPMNLGQILRTCDGAGVHGVILLKHRSIHLNQTAAQISQGAFAWMPVMEVTNLRNTLEDLKEKGLWVVGCEGSDEARPWCECRMDEGTVLVFGAEGSGMRPLTRKTCDVLGSLPMSGQISSLNVGAAVSAFVYEAARQRQAWLTPKASNT